MSAKSDYLENKILDHTLGNTAYSAPATIYVALYTAAPNDAGGGTEVSGYAYARKSVTNNTTNWPNASGGSKSNGADIEFAAASGGNWGTVTHFALFDAATAGNMLYYGALTSSKTINDGDQARFATGALTITEA
ncbi:MAG: phage tail fiber protein [Verrucomicrobiota bacterium]